MPRRERWSSLVLALVTFAIVGLVLRNVFGDNDAVMALAKKTGCDGVTVEACAVVELQRNPIGQDITVAFGKSKKQVHCARAQILVGDYSCEKQP